MTEHKATTTSAEGTTPGCAEEYITRQGKKCTVRPDVINYDDVRRMVPALDGHRRLVETVMHLIGIDKVNEIHGTHCYETGIPFSHLLVDEEFKFRLRVDNEDVLSRFPEGAFITVSNHPFGGMDGIILLHLVGKHRNDFRVMVNYFLNNIRAMRSSFIAVDPIKDDSDPEKKKITMQGIREAMAHLKAGHPLGFFPAGAVSKIDRSLHVRDREWQPSVIRLIRQMKVPVVPIYFHGHNSTFFNILGLIDWRLRSLRLPRELFRMYGKEIHISVGEPVTPEEIAQFKENDALGDFLRSRTYELEKLP